MRAVLPLSLLSLGYWTTASAAALASSVRRPDCTLAIECSNGVVYIGCDALQQCEDAGGSPLVARGKSETEKNVARSGGGGFQCEIIVYCSNGVTYRGCSAVKDCQDAGGVPGGSP